MRPLRIKWIYQLELQFHQEYSRSDVGLWALVSFNPLVPDAHYSERRDKPFYLQIQRLEVDLKLIADFYFLHPGH